MKQPAREVLTAGLPGSGASTGLSGHPFFAFASILLVVAVLYGHTLQVPFYLDDTRGLLENFPLRDLPATCKRLFSQRGLTNLTFAINYRLAGWALPPLHLVNVMLHAGCGVLVWRIFLRLLPQGWLPLSGALLFVAHPLQTQGVTYLVQRATVLAGFLSLLALLLYLQSRQARAAGFSRYSSNYLAPYLGALLAAAGAVLAKENAATLPLVLLVFERLFPLPQPSSWRQTLLDLLPFLLVPAILGGSLLIALATGEAPRAFIYPLASLQHNSPLHYLVTQFSVVWVYLRLLLLPYGQALEHNYPIVAGLVDLRSALALAGLLAIGWAGWRWRRHRPLVAFGVAWFFLALAVESSLFPLDPLFEHRLYLPWFGCVLVLLAILAQWSQRSLLLAGMVLVLGLYGTLTWQRNALWNDAIAFYQQNLSVAPDSERAAQALAHLYGRAGRHAERWQLLTQTVARYPANVLLYGDLARLQAAAGQVPQALQLLETGIARAPQQTMLYESAAVICMETGRPERAIDYLRRGTKVEQANRGRLFNTLGVLYSDLGASTEAEQAFRAALAISAGAVDRANTYLNLAREYYRRQRWEDAFVLLQTVLALNPGDPEALERLGEMAIRVGNRRAALEAAQKLAFADPQGWQRLAAELNRAGWQENP